MDFIVSVFYLKFDILKKNEENDNHRGPGYLAITIDIKAKIVRKESLLVTLNKQRGIEEGGDYTCVWTPTEIDAAQNYIGSVVLYSRDQKSYAVIELDFVNTWDTLMIPRTDQSHSQYFDKKGIKLTHQGCKPILVVRGRRGSVIYFPPELASLKELPPEVREHLPHIGSFLPLVRNQAVDNLVGFLKKRNRDDDGSNLLLEAGFRLGNRKTVPLHVLPPPDIEVPTRESKVPKETLECFTEVLKGVNYHVQGNDCTKLRGVLFYNSHESVSDPLRSAEIVYKSIAGWVNGLKAKYSLSKTPWKMIDTGRGERSAPQCGGEFSRKQPRQQKSVYP
jgi:hypothetical protein